MFRRAVERAAYESSAMELLSVRTVVACQGGHDVDYGRCTRVWLAGGGVGCADTGCVQSSAPGEGPRTRRHDSRRAEMHHVETLSTEGSQPEVAFEQTSDILSQVCWQHTGCKCLLTNCL